MRRDAASSRPRERGSAVIVVLALLVIILLYIGGNLQAIRFLDRDLRLIEREEIQRAGAGSVESTNTHVVSLSALPAQH